MAKTLFLCELVDSVDDIASHVGFDLTQPNPAAIVGEGIQPISFQENTDLINALGTPPCPVTPTQLMAGEGIPEYDAWLLSCYDSLQTWLNTLDDYFLWSHKSDCWVCTTDSPKVVTQIANADTVYALTDTGIEWLINSYSLQLLDQNTEDCDASDMEFIQQFIIDNYTGTCAEYVTKAHEIDGNLVTFQNDISAYAYVTQLSRDDLGDNNITNCSVYPSLSALYNA